LPELSSEGAADIRRKLGGFSGVTLLKSSKTLVVQARVGDLQRVFGREIEKAEAETKVKKSTR
jgi:hypothetical protein